jgi:hypothetical protein
MRKWYVAIAVSAGFVGLGGAASAAASAHPSSPTVAVEGAVAAPATYSLSALRAMPQSTFSVTRGTHAQVDQGVSLESLVDASQPQLPSVKNALLTAIITVADPSGRQRTFALGELDAGFGNHPAYVALEENGVPLDRPELIVPGDRNDVRSVPDVSKIGVAIEDPAVVAPPEVGALTIEDGATTTVLSRTKLASLPQQTLTVTYMGLARGGHRAHAVGDAVGSDGYVATVTPAEAWVGGRPLLISLAEDGQSFFSQQEGPRLVTDGDIRGGRYVTGMDDLFVGDAAARPGLWRW